MINDDKDLFESICALKSQYFKLAKDALREGVLEVGKVRDAGKYIGKYYDFPNLSFGKNGLPKLSSAIGNGPPEYRSCFVSYGGDAHIKENELTSFKNLVDFVRSNPSLYRRFVIDLKTENAREITHDAGPVIIISCIKDTVERYLHRYKESQFEDEKAADVLASTISYIFNRQLNIDIAIPILFLRFDFDEFELTDQIFVRKISDGEQKARYKIKSYNTSVHDSVVNCATHALVFKNWSVENAESMWFFDILTNASAYPIDQIDQFFGALRICSSIKTGYSQIYAVAQGWEASCMADLPHLNGVTVRSYPSLFEEFYWNSDDVPEISCRKMNEVKVVFEKIRSAKENAISLALKRLNRCLVRDDEEDAVLDATIALEALLSDGNQEMTHKLAMRVGALSKIAENSTMTPAQAFSDIKNIYGYRSAIVHGSKNPDKKRLIKKADEKSATAHDLLIEYLRMTLMVLLKNERYRNPSVIDEELLLGLHGTLDESGN